MTTVSPGTLPDRQNESVSARVDSKPTSGAKPWVSASLTRNTLANWLSLASGIVYSLIITRFIVHALGTESYGVWSFLNGLTTYADLFYLGLGTSLVRYAAEHRAKGELDSLRRLGSVVFTVYLAIAALLIVLGVVLGPLVPHLFAAGLSPDVERSAALSCVLIGVRMAALFFGSAFGGLLFAYERNDVVKWVMIAVMWLRFILIPLSVRGADSMLALAVISAVTGWIEALALMLFARKVTGGVSLGIAMPRINDLRPLYVFGIASFLAQIAAKLVSYSDTTVIGMRLGADAVTVYNLPLQLSEYARFAVISLVAVLMPRLTVMYAQGHVSAMRQLLVRIARLSLFLGVVINVTLASLGAAFLERWIGSEFGGSQERWILTWLALAGICQAASTHVTLPFYQSMNEMRFPLVVLIVEAALNLTGSIILSPIFGPAGVAFATFVPACCLSLVLIPRHLCRRLDVSVSNVTREVGTPSVLVGVVVVLAMTALNAMLPSSSYTVIALKGAVATSLATVAFAFMFPREDRQTVFGSVVTIFPPVKRLMRL